MIAQHPVGPGSQRQRRFIGLDHLANGSSLPRAHGHQLKIEGQMSLVELLTIVVQQTCERKIDLSDQDAFDVLVHNGAHLLHNLVDARLVLSVEVYLTSRWV